MRERLRNYTRTLENAGLKNYLHGFPVTPFTVTAITVAEITWPRIHFLFGCIAEAENSFEWKGYEQIVADVSAQQLAVLRTIAQMGGTSIQSGDFLALSGIRHASSAKAAATQLVPRRILQETPDGLKFSNTFFQAWLVHVRY